MSEPRQPDLLPPSPIELADRLRPITPAEWPRFVRAMRTTFGEPVDGPWLDEPSPVAELDRSLALFDGERVAATSGIYTFAMTVPGGGAVPTAGITWVTVSPAHRRRGVLTEIMRRQLTGLHEAQQEPVAALWAAEGPIYGRFGYAPASWRGGWTGELRRLRLRPDVDLGAGAVRLVDAAEFHPAAVRLHERLRREVPGTLARNDAWWTRTLFDPPAHREGATELQHVLHVEPDGEVSGYALYRLKAAWSDADDAEGSLTVREVRAGTPTATAALWSYLLGHDLVRTVSAPDGPVDDPLQHLLTDPRAWHPRPVDALWVRLVDVGRALSARRYPAPLDLVLDVRDRFCDWNDGRWHLWGHPAGANCDRTDRDPDLVLDVEALAAAYLGGVSLASLQAAGRVVERSPGAVVQASTGFGWPVAPWCSDHF